MSPSQVSRGRAILACSKDSWRIICADSRSSVGSSRVMPYAAAGMCQAQTMWRWASAQLRLSDGLTQGSLGTRRPINTDHDLLHPHRLQSWRSDDVSISQRSASLDSLLGGVLGRRQSRMSRPAVARNGTQGVRVQPRPGSRSWWARVVGSVGVGALHGWAPLRRVALVPGGVAGGEWDCGGEAMSEDGQSDGEVDGEHDQVLVWQP